MTVQDEVARLARGWAAKAEEDLLAAEHLPDLRHRRWRTIYRQSIRE